MNIINLKCIVQSCAFTLVQQHIVQQVLSLGNEAFRNSCLALLWLSLHASLQDLPIWRVNFLQLLDTCWTYRWWCWASLHFWHRSKSSIAVYLHASWALQFPCHTAGPLHLLDLEHVWKICICPSLCTPSFQFLLLMQHPLTESQIRDRTQITMGIRPRHHITARKVKLTTPSAIPVWQMGHSWTDQRQW